MPSTHRPTTPRSKPEVGSPEVSIGQVKRDISSLVNRVAFGGERIILTSRGKPKAVLIGLDDYQRLQQPQEQSRRDFWRSWFADADALHQRVLDQRGGRGIDLDAVMDADRRELEERFDSGDIE